MFPDVSMWARGRGISSAIGWGPIVVDMPFQYGRMTVSMAGTAQEIAFTTDLGYQIRVINNRGLGDFPGKFSACQVEDLPGCAC